MKNMEKFIDKIAGSLYLLSKAYEHKCVPFTGNEDTEYLVFDTDSNGIKKWLLKECENTIMLNDTETAILEHISDKYKYIVKSMDRKICFLVDKPYKKWRVVCR